MHIIILSIIVILSFFAFMLTGAGSKISDFLAFFTEGKDIGFSNSDLLLLWRTAKYVGLEEKKQLFWSVSALDECIKFIARQVDNPVSNSSAEEMQKILNGLYSYRTKIELEQVQKKRSLESTYEICPGQICIILVPGKLTVYAKLVKNNKDSLRFALFDASSARAASLNWKNKDVRIYFWKQNDAGYIFSSAVINSESFEDRYELTVKHSEKIVRTQKRKSVRVSCNFEALIFPLQNSQPYDSVYLNSGGVKCTINDISEDGAMFFVKGKGANGVKLKLQFKIKNEPIVMCGKIVRFVYDELMNKSRVHFQCEFLEQKTKNSILSYVYNIASEDNVAFISHEFNENENSEIPKIEDDFDTNN